MKDKIQKLAGLNKEVVDLIKSENMDQAVEKLAEIQELTKEMEESAVETPADPATPTDDNANGDKPSDEEIKKAVETINKYTTLNISAESIKDLMDQFAQLSDKMTAGLETINKVNERLEVVEKAKGISKQAGEPVNKTAGDNVWADLPL